MGIMVISKIFYKIRVLGITFIFIFGTLAGCATLGKEECMNADWKIIGYEDGASGYLTSRIGNHRKDCAKYGITPDFKSYEEGRLEGLKEYCTPQKGYLLGRSGKQYNNVCSPELELSFLKGYQKGRSVYEAQIEVKKRKTDLRRMQNELNNINKELKAYEIELISEDIGPNRRKKLLEEIKTLTEQRLDLQNQIAKQENLLEIAVIKFKEISTKNPYQ